jgi:hypothetical protein
VSGPVGGRCRFGAYLSTSWNKGALTLLIFEHQVVDLLQVDLVDLDADEFRSSFWRFLLFGAWRIGYLDQN